MEEKKPICPIAVIGLACWYPGARNAGELWENILSRRRQFRRMPDRRTPLSDYYHPDPEKPDKTYLKTAALIDGFNFDWKKRRIPFSTYQSTDIVHWLALEIAMAALADAGYPLESLPGQHTGVIVGNTLTGEYSRSNTMRLRWPFVRRALYAAAATERIQKDEVAKLERSLKKHYKSIFPPVDEDSLAGGLSNTIAGRICNYLDLGGGGYTIDGACSSSLLAIATAATGLMNKDLNLALAGGVDVSLDPFEIIGFAKAGALATDDMKVYDRRGDGFLPGEGCGFVVLKRLEDARRDKDYIYAVLHGWGISSDGRGTGITAPNAKGQAMAIQRAYARAPFKIDQLDFIEGHGTGTAIGDQVELHGITRSIEDTSPSSPDIGRFCGITSLKSVIGHTKAAAGIGAFIKAVMAVNRRILPPTAACRYPHPAFRAEARALYPILTGKITAPDNTLRAGISAMGFGGINCHVCLESADPPSSKLTRSIAEQALLASHQETELFVFSDQSSTDLISQIERMGREVTEISIADLTDLAADLSQKCDSAPGLRAAIIANHPDQLAERLNRLSAILRETLPDLGRQYHDVKNQIWVGNRMTTPRIGFLFPGQGAQQLNMAKRLIDRFEWARNALNEADRLLTRDGHNPIGPIVFHDLDQAFGSDSAKDWARDLARTENAQPAICLASILWLRWLEEVGVRPTAVGGHSLGELTAFHAAGAFDTDTLVRFSGYRGRIFANQAEKKDGAMIGLRCSKKRAENLLKKVGHYAIIANINSPRQVVIAGKELAIKRISILATKAGIPAYRLAVSGAFHTKLVAEAANAIKKVTILPPVLTEPSCQIYSGMDGTEIKSGRILKDYFSDQVLTPVNFTSLVQSMSENCDLFIEVGPGQALSGMINDVNGGTGPLCLPVESKPGRDRDINQLLATLFVRSADINWDRVYESRLVRPFMPPSERLFFENPCERPFETTVSVEPSIGLPPTESLETLFAGLGNISGEKIGSYLKTRGAFLTRVIQADMEYTLPDTDWVSPAETNEPAEVIEPDETRVDRQITDESIDSILIDALESITGFSRDTLTPDMRLLEDLNLDSIKTGDLLTRVAKAVGLIGEIAPLDFANLTLEEIVNKFNLAKARKTKSTGSEKPDILAAILDQVAKLIGDSSVEISADAVVENDLRISKGQFKKILPGLSHRLKLDIHVDLDPLLKRTLRQIASILQRISDQQQRKPSFSHETDHPPWIREFHLSMNPQRPPKLIKESKRREDDWQYAYALILADKPENNVARAVAGKLSELGARVDVSTHTTALEQNLMAQSDYSHFFNILPTQIENARPHYDHTNLKEIVTRLAGVATIAPASRAPRRRNTVAFLQFGGGYFGTRPETAFLHQCGATALAASIHQERSDLRVRVLDFSSELSSNSVAEKTVEEIITSDAFAAVGYDQNLTRRERYQRLMEPGTYKARSFTWNKEDVILVTGGAKGITAECALGVARACGARMALVGRSPHPDPDKDNSADVEIFATLKKYADQNLSARYFTCDIGDRNKVKLLVDQIKEEMGPISGVIHGAGLNIPKNTTQVSIEEAIREVSPKVLGALNIMAALDQMPPKLFIGLTSIIGVTGLPGNAWYGFSNEALDIILQRFEADHSGTRTLSVAYSIWQDEGMGTRMGSVNVLNKQGISAIPTEEGVDRFIRLFFNDPGAHQVIVAARLSGLDTWRFEPKPIIENARFLEQPLHITPGVESVFRVNLTFDKDPYIEDHKFEGSYLFPAVFGLEAMAQTIAHVTGIDDFSRVRIENIQLTRPITVDPEVGTDILVWAEVDVQITDSGLTIVRAGIYQPGIGVDSDSFSATFFLGLHNKRPTYQICLPEKPLGIKPVSDLYCNTLFFQGPRFQRIKTIWSLESDNYTATSSFTTDKKSKKETVSLAFSDSIYKKMILGDAFFRDSLLQSAAILVPQGTYLPVFIDRLDIYPDKTVETESSTINLVAKVELLSKDEKEIKTFVVASKPDGTVLERLEGYRLRFLSHNDDYPTVADLVDPDMRDSHLVQTALKHWARTLNIQVPHARIAYLPGMHSLSRKSRHQLELPLISKTVRQAIEATSTPAENFEIQWHASGRPVVTARERLDLEVSLSHDDRLCLVIAGKGLQGCDISEIISKSREGWIEILGKDYSSLLESLTDGEDSLDRAGIRIWSCLEAIHKTGRNGDSDLKIIEKFNDAILFETKQKKENLAVLTFPLRFTRGKERMLAFIAIAPRDSRNLGDNLTDVVFDGYEEIFNIPNYQLVSSGPRGHSVYIHRIPLGFKPSAQLSRKVYFSNYLFWAGEVREVSAWPVLEDIAKDFSSGRWGAVTNNTYLRVLGEPTTGDQLEVRMWTSGRSGPFNAITDLTYDFRKMLPGGGYERVAWLEQQSTWVEILGHGIVKPAPFSKYYTEFMDNMIPLSEPSNMPDFLPESLVNLHEVEKEQILFQAKVGPNILPILYEQFVETSLCDSNIVGNIYFASYHSWLGFTRDQYFYQLVPDYYQGIGEKGELLCIECRVNHLREAMPFDRIVVTMALKKLTRAHVFLYFGFFRQESNGQRTKLAFGEQTNVWVKRNSKGKPEATPFPKRVRKAFYQAISESAPSAEGSFK